MKTPFLLMLVVMTVGCASSSTTSSTASSTASSTTSSTSNRSEDVQAACTQLVVDYAYYRDLLDADPVSELFSEEAQLSVQGQQFNGRAAIRQRIVDGKNGPKTRHMMSTIKIFPESATRAKGVSYATIYVAPLGAGSDNEPIALSDPAAVGEYYDEFVLTADGWRIAKREFRPAFVNTAGN